MQPSCEVDKKNVNSKSSIPFQDGKYDNSNQIEFVTECFQDEASVGQNTNPIAKTKQIHCKCKICQFLIN